MTTQYTVSQSAKRLGISVSNLKRTADDFHTILPDYETTSGARRTFTEADLRTISAVLTRLVERKIHTRAQVLAELSESGSEPLIIPDSIPDKTPIEHTERSERTKKLIGTQTDIESPQDALAPFLQAQDDTRRQLAELSARIAEIATEHPQNDQPAQGDRRQLWVFAIAMSLALCLLFAGVTVSAILRDSQAALWTSGAAAVVLIVAIVWPSLRR